MKCLVTGGAGFIGSHLVDLLLKEGYEVVAIDNLYSGSLSNLKEARSNKNFNFIEADIFKDDINSYFKNINYVFHLAGLADIVPSIQKPVDYFNVNVNGTLNVLEACKVSKVEKIIYAASSSSYGIPKNFPTSEVDEIKPLYPYALTKYMGEELIMHWCKVYKIKANSLRLFNVYGPRSRTSGAYGAVFGVFLTQKINNKPFTVVGDGKQTRDFTYVSDVARAFLFAAKKNISGEVLNVGSGSHYEINYLVSLLKGPVEYIPKRPGEPDCTFADTTKINNLLSWKPEISFEKGVETMLNSINNWKNAPLWDSKKISNATEDWFKFLG